MYLRPESPSPLEVVLARMRKREEGPWGKMQNLGHQWLSRLEGNRFVQSYAVLRRKTRSSISLRSEPAIDLDSVFFLSLFIHLLLLFLISWITFSSSPLSRPGPIFVRFLDLGKPAQGGKEKPRKEPKKTAPAKPSPTPKEARQKPAVVSPKPAPLLPAPKVLAESPKEDTPSLTAESAEALIRLPTRQSSAALTPQLEVETTPEAIVGAAPSLAAPKVLAQTPKEDTGLAVESVEALIQLPSRKSGSAQTPQLKVETASVATVGTVSKEEIELPKQLLKGEGPSVRMGSPSVLSSPDFAPYLEMIKRRVQSVWQYPEGISGVHHVNLVFVLDRGGKLFRVEVLDSTDPKLDSSAVEAVKRAFPFPPIPETLKELAGWPLRIRFTVDFGVKVAR